MFTPNLPLRDIMSIKIMSTECLLYVQIIIIKLFMVGKEIFPCLYQKFACLTLYVLGRGKNYNVVKKNLEKKNVIWIHIHNPLEPMLGTGSKSYIKYAGPTFQSLRECTKKKKKNRAWAHTLTRLRPNSYETSSKNIKTPPNLPFLRMERSKK